MHWPLRSLRHAWPLPIAFVAAQAFAADQVAEIEFFGYKGLDIVALRKAVPLHQGDSVSDGTKKLIREAIAAAVGQEPTDVAVICCDEQRDRLIFIGVPGASYKRFAYNPEPRGEARLSAEIISLYDRLSRALEAAVMKGGEAAQEDDSKGYALVKDPKARALQLEGRRYAIKHEDELLRVLELSSDVEHRRVASDALGYARQSGRQVRALLQAARDPDDEVRNNATRALGVLMRSGSKVAREIPPDTFIEMMNSGAWTDRNKGAFVLERLTASRDVAVLSKLRAGAIDSLVEMALWRRPGHAYHARMLAGRIAGLPEEQLAKLAWDGPLEAIIDALVARGLSTPGIQ